VRLHISQPSLSNQIRKLERSLGTDLFVRSSREVSLSTAGRALVDEAQLALAALERAAEHTRLAGAGITGTLRMGYPPPASLETLGTLLAAVEDDNPNMTVVASELFSAQVAGRVLAGDLDVGLALHPEKLTGVRAEALRIEPLAAVLGGRHRLAKQGSISLVDLKNETLLLFPRELAPAYYDRIMEACESVGFRPRVNAPRNPPVLASIARLPGLREVGLIPASFAFHLADAQPGVVAREIVAPAVLVEWSILSPASTKSVSIARFLESARRCASANDWLTPPETGSAAPEGSPTATAP
jgi:DNA-binding transcriptional LysR family regulator